VYKLTAECNLISDQFNDQVIEVDFLANGNIVFTQGDIGVPLGSGKHEANFLDFTVLSGT
jgi:hypothetical protein